MSVGQVMRSPLPGLLGGVAVAAIEQAPQLVSGRAWR